MHVYVAEVQDQFFHRSCVFFRNFNDLPQSDARIPAFCRQPCICFSMR